MDEDFDDDTVFELSRLTAIRYIGIDGRIFYEVYWDDNRGEEPEYEEKMALVHASQRNAMMSEMEFEVIFRGENDDDYDEDDDDD